MVKNNIGMSTAFSQTMTKQKYERSVSVKSVPLSQWSVIQTDWLNNEPEIS